VLIIIMLLMGAKQFAGVKYSPQFYLAWLLGSCGLFFLPLLIKHAFPAMGILTRGFTDWDTFLLGATAHSNPLFASVLLPFIISAAFYKTRMQKLAAGFAVGAAASLLYAFLFSSADVQWIPGSFILDKIWLLLNFAGALILAMVLMGPHDKKVSDEGSGSVS
jgi:hypothetical protein